MVRRHPLQPRTTRSSVGSPTTAKSHGWWSSISFTMPRNSVSSSTTQPTVTVPCQSLRARSSSNAASMHASGPFISVDPRPHNRPSRTSPLNGSMHIPATLTVSVWPLSSRCGPSPFEMVKDILSRPGNAGSRRVCSSCDCPQFSSQSTTAPSPALFGSCNGLTLGRRTSCWAISSAVIMKGKSRKPKGKSTGQNLKSGGATLLTVTLWL